jgi:ABC-type transport system involved in cytochrome c biogenesis permease subunit
MKAFLTAFLLTLSLTAAATLRAAADPDPAWLRDPGVVAAFRSIPIQEGGRVKPLDTHARFLLLRLHGKQSIKVDHPALPDVKKLSAAEWMLLTWFRPDIAKELPLLVVDNSQAVGEIDIEPKELRDRYSWAEINPARDKLMERARAYGELERDDRTGIQNQVLTLARNFFDYDAVLDFLAAPRTDWRETVWQWLPDEVRAGLPETGPLNVWQVAAPLGAFIREKGNTALAPESSDKLLNTMIDKMVRPGMTLSIIPPADRETVAWIKLGDLVTDVMRDPEVSAADVEVAQGRDRVVAATADGLDAFRAAFTAWANSLRDAAQAREELVHVDREISYYQRDYFTNSLVLYLLGFLLAIGGMLAPGSGFARVMGRIALVSLVIALSLNTWGIVQRCLITERPPIATLYETIIFITACCALVSLLIERFLKNNAGYALTGFLGALGMFLSNRFMALDGQDTMPTLEAVLITNFWLATHVTIINIGYAGCLLASIISMVHLGYRTFARGEKAQAMRRMFTRVTYGVVCFGLLFSLVGTVLGGIWANDSWGRFWGWDPKENGALMIVLMGLIILHARLGGLIKETGLHVLSVLMGAVTLFSWFGTNQLGVGLHSYGFTDGIWRALLISWGIQAAFMLLGIGHWARDKWGNSPKTATRPAEA